MQPRKKGNIQPRKKGKIQLKKKRKIHSGKKRKIQHRKKKGNMYTNWQLTEKKKDCAETRNVVTWKKQDDQVCNNPLKYTKKNNIRKYMRGQRKR